MKRNAPIEVKRLVAACLVAMAPHAALAASGEFTFVVGEVSLTKANGQRSTPARGTVVDAGDRITTGANGMVQLTMVDQARLSLRPSTQFLIEAYPDRRDSEQGGILNLLKGTLRTFTGLIASSNRDRFVMKTRVATVGIRGSGNILYACEGQECDESVSGGQPVTGAIAVNHTIEGNHAISNISSAPTGTPAQQGGEATLITGPGQTAIVAGNLPPRYIPTPRFIADVAINMTGSKDTQAPAPGGAAAETRNFSPSDTLALPPSQQSTVPSVGNNGLGFPTIDATANLGADPQALRDIVFSSASPFHGQALPADVVLEGNSVRGYRAYGVSGVQPTVAGGAPLDFASTVADGTVITWGRWSNASLGFFGGASGGAPAGSVHWINAPSGYPTYLSEVLTGTATYTLVGGTSPTNQNNVVGSLGTATLAVNFSNRTLGFNATVSIPAQGSAAGGTWQMSADSVPIALNVFFASTQGRLRITNGTGSSSASTNNLAGSIEGGFVGTGLGGAILGYGISDTTAANLANWHFVSGVAAFAGTRQDAAAAYREGRVSDADGNLTNFIRSYATTNRPDEVASDAQGRATAFSAPSALGVHSNYALGSAQVVQSGVDAETGLIWGRWSGGTATATRAGVTTQVFLNNSSLHYIFAAAQSGPVGLPLTGTAVYDVIGSTSPTDFNGQVGTLNTATLNANFSNRTADASVNIAIAGQTWNAAAAGMPIYRDQYFSAFSGSPIPGLPNPAPLIISCTPNCGQNAAGSFDGFFTGRTGARAGLMYNMGGNQGAVAFGRRGGG